MNFFPGYPGFPPGVLVALLISTLTYASVAHRLRITRLHAFGLLMSVGVILAATLFPDVLPGSAVGETVNQSVWSCDLDRVGPTSLTELLELHEATANVLLFMPLGLLVALLPRGYRAPAVLLAVAFPVVIEAIQMLFPSLDRACQSADVADNLSGLAIGLMMGLAIRRLVGSGKPS